MKRKIIACAAVIGFIVFAFGFTPYALAQTVAGSFQGTNALGTNYFLGRVYVGTNAGSLLANGQLGVSGSIYYLNGGSRYLTHTTSDGSDTGEIYIQGGGGVGGDVTRGSSLYVSGNEVISYGGQVWICAGDVLGGNIYLTVSNYVKALTVLRSGNVGIGTTTPSAKLHVSGSLVVGTGTAAGQYSVAEGSLTTASGWYSHAEGADSQASGNYSHAEANETFASGQGAHSEGTFTFANGNSSHAEGGMTTAAGNYSHAAGQNASANHNSTYVWSDGATFSSTTNNQFSVYAANGARLMGGPTVIARGGDISMGTFTNMPPQ